MIIDDINKGPLTFHAMVDSTRRIVQAMCPFKWDGREFVARVQRPFRPMGLVIWNAPKDTMLEQAVIDNTKQLVVSHGGIPARFFAYGDSYEQIVAKLDAGLQPPAWGTWSTVLVGCEIMVMLTVDDRAVGTPEGITLAMWGISVL